MQDELKERGINPPGDDASDAEIKAYTNQVNNIVDARVPSRSVGSNTQRLIQSATAVVQGLVSGDIGKGLANASEPELNRLIHQATDKYDLGEQGNLALHAVLGAVIAEVNDNSAISGAAGATTAEALSYAISERYYHKSVAELTDDEKANLSSLTSLAAGLVGAATGDNASDAVQAASSGKSAVENNSLGDLAAALQQGKTPQQVAKERVEAENERYRKENCAGMSQSACNTKMYKERQEALKEMGLATIDFIPVTGTAKSLYEAESALDYVEAAASLIPLGGPAAKGALKAARVALKKGDIEAASHLINEASKEVHKVLTIERKKYPESAKHIEDAQASGHPIILTLDRKGVNKRRRESMKGTSPVKGKDRDEYPPAVTKEGGHGASIRPINPSDNRGAGACLGAQCRKLPDGTTIIINDR